MSAPGLGVGLDLMGVRTERSSIIDDGQYNVERTPCDCNTCSTVNSGCLQPNVIRLHVLLLGKLASGRGRQGGSREATR